MFPFFVTAANQNGGHPNATGLLMPEILIFNDSGSEFGVLSMKPLGAQYEGKLVMSQPYPADWQAIERNSKGNSPRPKGPIRRGKPAHPGKPLPASPAPHPAAQVPARSKRPKLGLITIHND